MASATMENFAGLDVALQPASLSLYATKQALIQGYLATAPNGKIPSARLFFREIAVGVCRDGITATVREGFKLLVQKTASPALTRRLTKVVGTSAVRKHARYTQAAADSAALHFPLLHAALDTVPVAVFSSLLPQLATLLVEEAIVVVVYLRSHGRERDRTALVLHTKQNVFLCFASVALGGVCAGVGTAISPGRGTNAGLFIGNAIMYLI